MPLTRMEHYLVLSDDIEKTRLFYRDVLGFHEGFRPTMDFAGYWLYLGDSPCIHIADRTSYERYGREANMPVSERAAGTGPVDHIAFSGSGYEEMTSRLDGCGASYEQNLVPDIGLRQLFLLDPNGVKIELNFMPEG